jgi:hypothetical protein
LVLVLVPERNLVLARECTVEVVEHLERLETAVLVVAALVEEPHLEAAALGLF